jgi:hypothetical protein
MCLSFRIRVQFVLRQQELVYVVLTKASLHPKKMQVIAVPSVAVLDIELFTAFRRKVIPTLTHFLKVGACWH